MSKKISYEGYKLVFSDEFQGPELNRDDWTVELHPKGWVNEEWQEYVDSPENLFIEDGHLVIRPIRTETPDGVRYTSGRITTRHKRDFTYGLFEARLKVPAGQGFLPAFWLLASNEGETEFWPVCGEIDIMEIWGQKTDFCYGTLHYGLPKGESQGTFTAKGPDFAEEFHLFQLEWEPGVIRWFIDGEMYYETAEWYAAEEGKEPYPYPAPFDHDMAIILNLAVGGNWVGYPDETTDFSHADYLIDYVRVFQKKPGKEGI